MAVNNVSIVASCELQLVNDAVLPVQLFTAIRRRWEWHLINYINYNNYNYYSRVFCRATC